jgi:hypothetical protein
MACSVTAVVIGATRIVTKGLEKYLNALPWNLYKCTGNIAHNKESITILEPQCWGSPLVQEDKCHEKNPVTGDDGDDNDDTNDDNINSNNSLY